MSPRVCAQLVTAWIALSAASIVIGFVVWQRQDLQVVSGEQARREIQGALLVTIAAGLVGLSTGLLVFHHFRLASTREKEARLLAEEAVRASQSAREKSTFLANMSHEIRTPMNAILGFSDLLTAALPAEAKTFHYARSIRESSQSLLQLINDILDLSKLEAGTVELHLAPTDLRELVGFVRTVFAQEATRQDLKLEMTVAPSVPPALLLDHSRLRQVLINLVGHSLKFTEHGSVVLHVAWETNPAEPNHGALVVELTDTGIGIPADRLDDVFRPFARVDPRHPAEQQGTGLGLSIVRRLTEHMGGTVTIESIVNQGSKFHLRIPDIAISARLPVGTDEAAEGMVDFDALAPATLLVVDDNAVNRELLAGLFDSTHHTMRYAANGREAVESVRRGIPDLVLMDIRMPQMDGHTALAEIRKIPGAESCPIVAVTASSLQGDEPALRALFAGYVRKPYTQRQLYQAIAAHLPLRAVEPPAADTAASLITAVPDRRDRWPELVAKLRQLETSRWPAVRDSGAIFETREFARQLLELGRAGGCFALTDYATNLARDAETYAISRLEKRLDEFPMVIQLIAGQTPAATT